MKYCILFFIGLISYSVSVSQVKDLVETDGITSPLHAANKGRIVFTDGYIPAERLTAADFLERFVLNPATDLNIRVFMDNSITNYLHQLAPDETADQLIRQGNYQFNFYIDDALIYTENLHHGAGLKKHTTTTFRVPLTSTKGEDWWGIYLWNRFMANGGEEALTAGIHRLKIVLRPYYTAGTTRVGDIIATGELELIIKTPDITRGQVEIQPILPNSGWRVSAYSAGKENIEELNRQIALYKFREITSLVVIRNGSLLLEEYFNGANRETLHDTRSVGKSFTGTLMGIAIQEGLISSVKEKLGSFYSLDKFRNNTAAKTEVRISDLLTMSSALDGSDQQDESPGNEENMYPTADWVKFALDLPMDARKVNGRQWDYFTAGVVLLGDILQKSVPGGLEKFAADKLFQPLGIRKYQWGYTPAHIPNTAGGLKLRSLDLARFGQLYVNDGIWNGRQILSKDWVAASFHRYLDIPGRPGEGYGYLFWHKTFMVNGKPYETFYCAGNGGSKVYMFPKQKLTVVITAIAYNRPYAHPQVDKMMEQYILPAVFK